LAGAIVADEAMAKLLESPEIGDRQSVAVLADIGADAFDARFRDFLTVLASNGRLPLLPHIADLYRGLREEAEKRLSVRVVSAIPLDENQSTLLREALARRFDREIELENEIDAAVIGGAVVYAGDQVIDGSLRGRLQKLSNSLTN
jgi:F-type H+-transporting ATPase subunit delta